MATVTDQDFSTSLDAGERVAIPQVIVTGTNISSGGSGLTQGLVEFNAAQLQVSPGIGGAAGVFEFPIVTQVYQGAMLPVVLPDSNLAFSSTFTYTITLKIEGFTDQVFSSVVISKTRFASGTCDLSQLV